MIIVILFLQPIDSKYYKEGWIEDTPANSFDFDGDGNIIDVTLPPLDNFSGWNIKRKCTKKVLFGFMCQ